MGFTALSPQTTLPALTLTPSTLPCRKHHYYSCEGQETQETSPGHSSEVQGTNLAPSPRTRTASHRHLLPFLPFLAGKPSPLVTQFVSAFSSHRSLLCSISPARKRSPFSWGWQAGAF